LVSNFLEPEMLYPGFKPLLSNGSTRGCYGVVATPSFAAADHLAEMGVPRERMGFFPRGGALHVGIKLTHDP
jgi:hypothetical protein